MKIKTQQNFQTKICDLNCVPTFQPLLQGANTIQEAAIGNFILKWSIVLI